MSRRYALVVVEGPHDRGFVARVLLCLGFSRFDGKQEGLDAEWIHWKPNYPKNDNLYAPLDMPALLSNDTWSVGVWVAGGGEVWAKKKENRERGLRLRLKNNAQFMQLLARDGALAFVLDADNEPPGDLTTRVREVYQDLLPGLPTTPGMILPGPPRRGTFILPDNTTKGTVESLLLPLGKKHHGPLLALAETYVDGCEHGLKAHFAPFDHLKAKVAAAASILQPGSTNTVTIEQDAWITPDQLAHPTLAPFVTFLRELLELPEAP